MPAGSRRRRSQRLNQIEQDNEEPAAGWQQRLERVENGLGQLDELRELLQNINANTNNNVMVEEREVDHICYRAEKPACNPPTFDGKQDFAQFKQQFADCCTLNGWGNDMRKALWLRVSLKGEARGVIKDEQETFEVLMDRLENRYGAKLKCKSWDMQLTGRKRRQGESLIALSDDISKLCGYVYEDLPPVMRERRAVAHFINALTSPYAQHELHLANPQTMEQAFEIAAFREAAIGREDPVFNRQAQSLQRTPAEPKTINNNYRSPEPTNDHNVRKPKCKHCSGEHFSYVCQPCRHCGGPHFDNKCDKKRSGTGTSQTQYRYRPQVQLSTWGNTEIEQPLYSQVLSGNENAQSGMGLAELGQVRVQHQVPPQIDSQNMQH